MLIYRATFLSDFLIFALKNGVLYMCVLF